MIFNSNEIYATVWKVTPAENGKYIDLQISTSEKDAEGKWENSNWFARAIGHAVNSLKGVKREDRITITKSKFTNLPYENEQGEKRSYFKFVIIEAKVSNKPNATTETTAEKPKKKETTPPTSVADTEDDPW